LTKVITFGLLLVVCSSLTAQKNYIHSRQVAPGVIHHHEYRAQGPWHIHVIEIDRKNPWIRLKTVKAGAKLAEREKTSRMTARYDSADHHVVSAINGDFYDAEGIPIGAQVSGGVLLKNPTSRTVFGISDSGIPIMDILSLSGSVWARNGSCYTIDGINETLTDSTVILYNSFFGDQTTTNQPGFQGNS